MRACVRVHESWPWTVPCWLPASSVHSLLGLFEPQLADVSLATVEQLPISCRANKQRPESFKAENKPPKKCITAETHQADNASTDRKEVDADAFSTARSCTRCQSLVSLLSAGVLEASQGLRDSPLNVYGCAFVWPIGLRIAPSAAPM